jgi:thymidylate synthase (FAD)
MIEATYVDHMGSDLSVVNAARVSFGKKSKLVCTNLVLGTYDMSNGDKKLIKYLASHKHLSPFGHCFASFHIKAPIFVARQLVKHKFLRWNEISRRYVSNDPEFYTPTLRSSSVDKKQGSGDVLGDSIRQDEVVRHAHIEALKQYKYLLNTGVCEEQARAVLPLSHMTEWYWSGSLDAFADMCRLRCASDTQAETQKVAWDISLKMEELFPVSWVALRDE